MNLPISLKAFQSELVLERSSLRRAITKATRSDESEAVGWLMQQVNDDAVTNTVTETLAKKLVNAVRQNRAHSSGVDALMQEFSLSSNEGVALMCLAEALLRIPDHQTATRLIADKISRGDWRKHLGESPSLFVNAATWGLLITGKLVATSSERTLSAAVTHLIGKGGEPLIRKGVDLAMRLLGNQFVIGQTIEQALHNSRANEAHGYRYSYDMLGESALTADDAARYFASYESAIHAIGKASAGRGIKKGPGISVKLSALHPRYVSAQRRRVMTELLPQLSRLARLAKHYDIGFNIDAEEADRLELSLDLIEVLAFDSVLDGYTGLGVVVQAYQKRCPYVIDFLIDLAQRSGRKMMVRLVKGAYWDAEIKRAQVDGLRGYPVYTRKVHTDLSYLVCAEKLLRATDVLYPQFATHNAYTLAAIHTTAQRLNVHDYEFQCLYGMGETLYDQVVPEAALGKACRIYAPVGSHSTLLAYLVRRLLENGANSSFVNQLVNPQIDIDMLLANPIKQAAQQGGSAHPGIVLPAALFGNERRNSAGLDFSDELTLAEIDRGFTALADYRWHATALVYMHDGVRACDFSSDVVARPLHNPADRRELIGDVVDANYAMVDHALDAAERYAPEWQARAAVERAAALTRAADLLEQHTIELMAILIREAGKSLPNAIAEVREAVDFLRYYAAHIDHTGKALGPVVCISPWNFPLAIFVGQIGAALAAGNVVLAKPAEQTPLVAWRATQLLHAAGIPRAALQLLPGPGVTIGARLVADEKIRGIIFTGSTEVAQQINRSLAARANSERGEVVLIAETGGQNAMVVDSSALLEQVVQDAVMSAFDSAGQRCSALRILCLQEDIADRTVALLEGAMQQLVVGNPACLSTDVGPVIDEAARDRLLAHIAQQRPLAKNFFALSLPPECNHGCWVAPTLIEIDSLRALTHEVFGPVLHVVRYRREQLPELIDEINAMGYGLTFGLHSRIDATIDVVRTRIHAGNVYINRSMVGAVVGVQPFGGEGQSGTGPKAGGPLYLKRLQHDPSEGIHGLAPVETVLPPTFDALTTWAAHHGHQTLGELCSRYAAVTLAGQEMVLPGPTGECNTLAFVGRGQILCSASSVDTLLNQLAAVFASTNTPVLDASSYALIPASLLPIVGPHIVRIDQAGDITRDLRLALADKSVSAIRRPLLAARKGPIVCLIETDSFQPIPMWRMVAERAVSINTTAAGGNASLMTLRSA